MLQALYGIVEGLSPKTPSFMKYPFSGGYANNPLIDYLYAYYGTPRIQPRFFASNNMALRTDRLLEVGGFDTTLRRAGGEDCEFCDRWQHAGYQLTFAPEAIVYYAHPMTAHSFWQQQFNYGCGAYHFHRARARRNATGVQLEPLSFYWNLLRHLFTQTPPRQALAVAALLVVSQGATAAGFFGEMLRQRRQGSMGAPCLCRQSFYSRPRQRQSKGRA